MKLEEIRKGVIRERGSEIKKLKKNGAKKIREWSWKAEVSPLTGVNVPRLDPDPIGIRIVAGRGVKLIVTVNGSRNRVRITVRVTALERLRDPNQGIRGQAKNFSLTRTRALPTLAFLLTYLLAISLCFQSKRVVSCKLLGLQQLVCWDH